MIITEYEWFYQGKRFHYSRKWPEEWHDHLKSLRHEIRDPAQWDYFIAKEPYKEAFIEFIAEVQDIGLEKVNLDDPRDMLEFMLAFVQHFEYVPDPLEYPKYPTEMLIDAGGDCEDSVF